MEMIRASLKHLIIGERRGRGHEYMLPDLCSRSLRLPSLLSLSCPVLGGSLRLRHSLSLFTSSHPLPPCTMASMTNAPNSNNFQDGGLQNDHSSTPAKTERVVIKGRVQGVCYRNWTVENASELGLKGWVRNRRDGSVAALFSGDPNSVDEMKQRCRRGPPAAAVTGFELFSSDEDAGSGFECRPTT